MVDLDKSGLALKLDGTWLLFGNELDAVRPDIRKLDQMKKVAMELSLNKPNEFYYMYRGIAMDEHKDLFEESGIRYDITVIPPLKLGKEYNKTFGHYHPKIEGTNYTYPEVYEVLSGKAHYLMQNDQDVILVEANVGDKVVMFPNYGHITINPGEEVLAMSNLVYSDFKSLYENIESKHGAMYYETTDMWVENKNYSSIPEMRKLQVRKVPEFGLTEKPMYTSFVENPKNFEWLKTPQNYVDVFADLMK